MPSPSNPAPPPGSDDAVERFQRSLNLDYERWREGSSYDLDALRAATPPQRRRLERLLLDRGLAGWREVEALATLATPDALQALRDGLRDGNPEVRLAILRHAPDLATPEVRTRVLVNALEVAEPYHGLTQALDMAADHHPPPVIRTLLRCARHRSGEVAPSFVSLLLFLHGKATSRFDWTHRPFFLQFRTEDPAERQALFEELCQRLGLDPGPPTPSGPSPT